MDLLVRVMGIGSGMCDCYQMHTSIYDMPPDPLLKHPDLPPHCSWPTPPPTYPQWSIQLSLECVQRCWPFPPAAPLHSMGTQQLKGVYRKGVVWWCLETNVAFRLVLCWTCCTHTHTQFSVCIAKPSDVFRPKKGTDLIKLLPKLPFKEVENSSIKGVRSSRVNTNKV